MSRNIKVVKVNVILNGLINKFDDETNNWVMGDTLKIDLLSPGNKMIKVREYEDFVQYFDVNEKQIEESLKEDFFVIHSMDKKSYRLLAEHKIMYQAMKENHLEEELNIQDENGSAEPFREVVDNLIELGIIDEDAMMVFTTGVKATEINK